MTPQVLLKNYLMVLNQHYALLSENKTGAVGVLTESTVLQLESKIKELRETIAITCDCLAANVFISDCYGSTIEKAESLGFIDDSDSDMWTPDAADELEQSAIAYIESKGIIFADEDAAKELLEEFLRERCDEDPSLLEEEPKWLIKIALTEAEVSGGPDRIRELRIIEEYEFNQRRR